MSFDVCSDCGGNEWEGVFGLVMAWALPTVLCAIHRQLAPGTASRSLIGVVLGWTAAGAAVYSALELGMVDVGEPVQFEALLLALEGGILSALSIRVYRWAQHRRGRWAANGGRSEAA